MQVLTSISSIYLMTLIISGVLSKLDKKDSCKFLMQKYKSDEMCSMMCLSLLFLRDLLMHSFSVLFSNLERNYMYI